MKKTQNLIGGKILNKKEQQSVKGGSFWGGFPSCYAPPHKCAEGQACVGTICLPIPV